MGDITEVIHKISYEVNDDALNNATKAIQLQIAELNKLSVSLDNYSRQLGMLSSVQAKEFDILSRRIDETSKRIDTIVAKSRGVLTEVFAGFTKGITGSDGIKDGVAKYVTSIISEFNNLKKAGEQVSIGFASHMTKMADSGQGSSGKLIATLGNLGKSLTSATGLIDLGVIALGYLGQELLKEGGIIDDFVKKEKFVVTETDKIINSFSDLTEKVSELTAEETINAKILYETATDINQTYGSRINAVKELQDIYPEYFGDLTKEAILAGNAALQYQELNTSIINRAYIDVYKDELKALISQERALERKAKLSKSIGDINLNNYLTARSQKGPGYINPVLNEKNEELNAKVQAEIEAEKTKNLEAQRQITERILNIQKEIKAVNKPESNAPNQRNVATDPNKSLDNSSQQTSYLKSRKSQPLPVEIDTSIDKKPVELPKLAEQQKGLSDEQKENIKNGIKGYQQLAKAAADAYNKIIQAQIDALDKEISIREKRVEEAKKLAERGNTEALRLEEDRLRKAQEQRAKFARQQQTVNAAITVSNAIAAVARAALEGGGFGSAATIAALIAALAAGYAAVSSMTSDSESFATGVVDYKGKGGPRDDKNWVRISSGESIITAAGTQKNRALLEAINQGAALHMIDPTLPMMMPMLKQPGTQQGNAYAEAKDLKRLETKLDEVVGAIENNKLKQNIFFNEQGVGIMTERAIQKDRKRWK